MLEMGGRGQVQVKYSTTNRRFLKILYIFQKSGEARPCLKQTSVKKGTKDHEGHMQAGPLRGSGGPGA